MSNLQIENLIKEDLERKFKVLMPEAEVTKVIEQKLAEIQPKYRQKGFRDGKVPTAVIKQKHLDSLLSEVANDTVQLALEQIMKDEAEKANFAQQPNVVVTQIGDGQDLIMEIDFELLPTFDDWDLSQVSLPYADLEIADDDLEDSIKHDLTSIRTWKSLEEGQAAQDGNAIQIAFVGSVDGQEFPGGKMDDYRLELGSGTFIPGFEEQLVGSKKGDTPTIKVTFPEKYHAQELAGKEAEFAVTVKDVLVAEVPELSDEVVKEHFHCDTVADYKEKIKNRMLKHADMAMTEDLVEQLLQEASKKFHDMPLPKKIFEQELQAQKQQNDQRPETERKSEDELTEQARDMLIRSFFVGDLSNKNGLMVSEEDVINSIMEIAKRYPGQEKMLFDMYAKNPRMLGEMRSRQLQEKVYGFIKEHVTLDKQKTSWKDYQKQQEEKAKVKETKK